MDRRVFLMASAAASAGFFVDPREAWGQPGGEKKAEAGPIDSPPVLQNVAAEAVTVSIAVRAISTAWVEYGEGERLDRRADDLRHGLFPLNGRIHRVRITGLKPGRKYSYRVGVSPIDFKGPYKIVRGAAAMSEKFSFVTPDTNARSCSFAVINDTHEKAPVLAGVTERLAAIRRSGGAAGLTFWNGDIFDDVKNDDQVVANVMRPGGTADSAYAAEWPLCFVNGNHDVRGIHARQLERFIESPGDMRRYVLRQGPVAFIVLDTGEDKPDATAVYAGLGAFERYREQQREWLEAAVMREEVRSAAHRVVVQHIPMWGGGASEDSRKKWAGTLAKAGISAMICGHIHKYAWTPADGDHAYPQLVGGGPSVEGATVVEGRADASTLSLIVRDLSGKEIGNYEIKGKA